MRSWPWTWNSKILCLRHFWFLCGCGFGFYWPASLPLNLLFHVAGWVNECSRSHIPRGRRISQSGMADAVDGRSRHIRYDDLPMQFHARFHPQITFYLCSPYYMIILKLYSIDWRVGGRSKMEQRNGRRSMREECWEWYFWSWWKGRMWHICNATIKLWCWGWRELHQNNIEHSIVQIILLLHTVHAAYWHAQIPTTSSTSINTEHFE